MLTARFSICFGSQEHHRLLRFTRAPLVKRMFAFRRFTSGREMVCTNDVYAAPVRECSACESCVHVLHARERCEWREDGFENRRYSSAKRMHGKSRYAFLQRISYINYNYRGFPMKNSRLQRKISSFDGDIRVARDKAHALKSDVTRLQLLHAPLPRASRLIARTSNASISRFSRSLEKLPRVGKAADFQRER